MSVGLIRRAHLRGSFGGSLKERIISVKCILNTGTSLKVRMESQEGRRERCLDMEREGGRWWRGEGEGEGGRGGRGGGLGEGEGGRREGGRRGGERGEGREWGEGGR